VISTAPIFFASLLIAEKSFSVLREAVRAWAMMTYRIFLSPSQTVRTPALESPTESFHVGLLALMTGSMFTPGMLPGTSRIPVGLTG
jgi:hypothetical protein